MTCFLHAYQGPRGRAGWKRRHGIGGAHMWQGVVWACALIGMPCDPVPDTATIQLAYEQEASSGKTLHDKGLKVLGTKCHGNSNGPFLCEITFTSASDPE